MRIGDPLYQSTWTCVRDDKPFAGSAPPAAVFFYSRDRTAQHPENHLRDYAGILQADAYAGYNRLYEAGRKPGAITEASCWAHGRRKLFELADVAAKARGTLAVIAPLAFEAVKRIDAIFDIEREINGRPIAERLAVRRAQVAPLVAELETWMRAQRGKLSRHSDVGKAIDYMLKRWDSFTRFLEDGRICLTNNAAERALRGIAILESLCIPSSSVCKHWNRVVVSDATRATFSGLRRFNRTRCQVVGANLVWRARYNLHRGQHAGFDQAAYRVACDAQSCSRLG
jgi:hypothetical protein